MDPNEIEVETIDLTDNINYQVLSAFFEDDNGNNICNILSNIYNAINNNTEALINITNKMNEFQIDNNDDDDDEDEDSDDNDDDEDINTN